MKKSIYRPTEKFHRVYKESPFAKFRLLEGVVRSGKTYASNHISLKELCSLPPCNVLVSGYSITTAARNVIAGWRDMIDPNGKGLLRQNRDAKDDFITIDWRGLRGKKFYVRGAGKENDYKFIQGATFGYWIADEFTRHHESFTDMSMTRLSPPFAKMIGTTNADSPFHYVKRRFLDNPKYYEKDTNGNSLWKRWEFQLSDNPSLTPDYVRSLSSLYTGVFYKRYVLGMWVLAEGAIYDMFDYDSCTLPREKLPTAMQYFIGVDYGTGAPTCFILFGYNPNTRPRIWAIKEYYWDSRERGKQKTDSEYANDLRKFIGDFPIEAIYVDPSAASFIAECNRMEGADIRLRNVFPANNEILDGIRTQAGLLSSHDYKLCRDCKRTIKDYDSYSWDEKLQLKGKDAPLAGPGEHTKDAERYLLHSEFSAGNVSTSGNRLKY